MSIENILSRLDGVKTTGSDRWIANCPAHEDKSPSLSLRILDDGRVLLHCFAGCGGADVVSAIGLTLSDLYPEKINHHLKGTKPNHWHAARDALKVLRFEVLLVAITAEDCSRGVMLSPEDVQRVSLAAERIRSAAQACQ